MNWRWLLQDPDLVLQQIEDLKVTCHLEQIKILFGFIFIGISAFILYSLSTTPIAPNNPFWSLFALLFSIAFGLLMFGLNLMFAALTSNAARNQRFQNEVNSKIDRLLLARGLDQSTTSTEVDQNREENDALNAINAIRDNSRGILEHLKNPNREERKLTYSNTLLAYVASIVALAAIGRDLYIETGLPLLPLYVGLICLLFGGIFFIYYEYSKWTPALLVVAVSIIGIAYVAMIIVAAIFAGTHIPSLTSGNVTNICDNCSYPVTDINNYYNVTIVGECTNLKNPIVSVEEMKYLIGSHGT
jgi:hypothetical protein